MRIISWNVNGLRAAVRKGFLDWLEGCGAEIVGLQEVRARREQLPAKVAEPEGWHVDLVAAELTAIDPEGDWAARAETLRADLESLDADIAKTLADIPAERRLLVTNHDSLGYFAERYDFEIVGTVVSGGSTMAEPSASDLAALVKVLIESDIRAIFAETTSPDTLAQAVASELGGDVEVFELYSGSLGEQGSGAETSDAMRRANADIVASALGG